MRGLPAEGVREARRVMTVPACCYQRRVSLLSPDGVSGAQPRSPARERQRHSLGEQFGQLGVGLAGQILTAYLGADGLLQEF